MDAEKMSAIDSLLAQLDQPDHTHVWSRDDVLNARAELSALRAENARMRERISDLVLLWSWGVGGKAGTGFAEKLGGDGDGETWAVKFDPMDPDEGCEFVVRVETGQDGLPILDDAARAALGGRDEGS